MNSTQNISQNTQDLRAHFPLPHSHVEPAKRRRALVLGGGGSTGHAWLIGMIAGLASGGVNVADADLLVGTSAGATVAAQISTGILASEALVQIFAEEDKDETARALSAQGTSASRSMQQGANIIDSASDPTSMRQLMGAAGLALDPPSQADAQKRWRDIVVQRLRGADWNDSQLVYLTAVDAVTGQATVFASPKAMGQSQCAEPALGTIPKVGAGGQLSLGTIPEIGGAVGEQALGSSVNPAAENPAADLKVGGGTLHLGTSLIDAVAASGANGFSVPPFRIGNQRFINGAYRRNENADLATGYQQILVLSPFSGASRYPHSWAMDLESQVRALRKSGSEVTTAFPDKDATFMVGPRAMDYRLRPEAARMGAAQGALLAPKLQDAWA